ncbi:MULTISPECIES: dynamin family protein [unclassified Microbacterium]|uniref:dynamin family protein n=1 Tax=unclassified Microbacterium TaxID=2609290 RepID=UPI00214B1FD5|nr:MULTISPECIES: dynamin family protein [unclassified Microbacterium]MCR2785027.1 dynamin family protein [Microbacterium sp. zg.B96]WIM16565.1 dynamin family protein [Microbacterium sp. zg-B96]
MRRVGIGEIAGVVSQARDLYADDPAAIELLDAYDRRLNEPLRLAVAGVVKAGKSTLLNALIGEQVAPTDAGECTKLVVWYRYSLTPRVTVHLADGRTERLPVRRSDGALELDLGSIDIDEVGWIDVAWPSEHLRTTVLIDTPGIASLSAATSLRTTRFLTPDHRPSDADAIIYLLRHIHASDVAFLESFRDTVAGSSHTVNAVGLLSRADEIGSGRIDSLISAARIAERYRRDGELRALTLGVIPVAGLLAEGARTLRESEFIAFRALAALTREQRERLFVSVDRFTRASADTDLSVSVRQRLLARFGLFGVRLGVALVRGGAHTSSELAERMIAQSGLIDVQRFVADQFRSRVAALKARTVLDGVTDLLREKPRAGATGVRIAIERVSLTAHDLRELALLAQLRTSVSALQPEDEAEAERIVGGAGDSASARLGLSDLATKADVREATAQRLAHWRMLEQSPLNDRTTTQTCRVVARSLEAIASEVGAAHPGGSGSDIMPSR